MNRAVDRMRRAKEDLQYATRAKEDRDFEWACVVAHRAAEQALKAVLQSYGNEVKGHSATNLCHALSMEITLLPGILHAARRLDSHSIQTRTGESEPLTSEDADLALKDAEQIITFCGRLEG